MLQLIIGNKNYSSWSLRPWLALKYFEIPFEEIYLPLRSAEYAQKITAYSPSGKVPCLQDHGVAVWDSLAICEYANDLFPQKNLWPQDVSARAVARAISAEMHSGFAALRAQFTMNIRRCIERVATPDTAKDIARIFVIWESARNDFGTKHGGSFLFGDFSIADAMYAPVVLRFQTYGVKLAGACADYAHAILNIPALKLWCEQAAQEKDVITEYEV